MGLDRGLDDRGRGGCGAALRGAERARARTDEAPSVPRESESERESEDEASEPEHASLDEEHAPLDEEHAPLDETRGAGAAPSTRARRAEDARSEPNDAITLARAGRFADAIAAVEAAGVERVLRASTPTERLELADAARYARDASLAKRFYEAGPRTGDAGARAAFGLARVALDLDMSADAAGSSAAADRAEAIRWLRTSLRRSSRGALAREARGRLMELLHASGDPSAREVANEYLALHPDGPQAETARRIASP